MACGLHPRTEFVGATIIILTALCAAIIGLTLGLATPALKDGGSPTLPPPAEQKPYWPSRSGQYSTAAVATDAAPCSSIGVNIMRDGGGSAVDAAIASTVCVGVVNCHSTGVGGGHFMTIYDYPKDGGEKELNTIISRGSAAAFAHRDMFVNDTTGASTKGGLSIAVPGEVSGFMKAHELYGKANWSSLFTDSIDLCYDGFEIGPSLASAIRQYEDDILNDEYLSEIFVDEDGNIKQEGDIIINEKLGDTLQIIADDPGSFYRGELAEDIIADIEQYGGNITLQDLQNYTTKVKDPLELELSNGEFTLYGPRPPTSGAVYQYILNILNGYHFEESDIEEDEVIHTYHRVMEAFKFAYAKRSDLGDEDYWDVKDLLINMTSPEYGEYIRSRIDESYTQEVEYYEPSFELEEDFGTVHISVFGPEGTAVAITSTINHLFGSNVRGNRTGIIFNDEMDDFSTPGTYNSYGVPASPSNYIEPGKMPMSSMCPMLVFNKDGEIVLASGGAGGPRITTITAWISMHMLWFGIPAHEATELYRLHHQLVPNEVEHEPEFDPMILWGLEDRHHVVRDSEGRIAVVQTIQNTCNHGNVDEGQTTDDECILAVCDGRKDGIPDGY